jgi:serine/threonine protein kinase
LHRTPRALARADIGSPSRLARRRLLYYQGAAMPNPAPGSLLGPYQVESVIGAGSMGDVFRGIDTGLNRKVAIKILSEKHRDSPELRARFVREGRAVAAISHPNVVQVFTTGTFDERPFIAMEFLDGTDLGTAVENGGPLSNLRAARAVLDAAQGLRAAAQAGLIHRDVKPSNLVLLADGRVKVTDFGLAKPVDPGTEPALTAMGVVVGTPDYIAPEQARGDAIDERVDVYALGGSLYFLLTGTPPFRTGKPSEDKYLKVVARHLRQPAPDARAALPTVDAELAEVVRAMMAKKASERPDYGALIARLERIVARLATGGETSQPIPRSAEGSGGLVDKTPFVGGAGPLAADLDGSADGPSLTDVPVQSRLPGWLWLVTVLAVLVFVAGLFMYLGGGIGAGGAIPAAVDAAVPPDGATAMAPAAPVLDAAPARPTAPPGMVLIDKPDGTPWLFVDARPVTHAAFVKVFPKHRKPAAGKGERPVTAVAYTFARAYAQSTGKRLLRPDEWDAAAATTGVQVDSAAWEWVDAAGDGKHGKDARRVMAPGRTQSRAAGAHNDVTFRLAQDL